MRLILAVVTGLAVIATPFPEQAGAAPAGGRSTPAGLTAPEPPPPTDPGGAARAAQAGTLISTSNATRAALEDLRTRLGERQELANRALADDIAARGRADEARRVAAGYRAGADRAAAEAERVRRDVDAWVTAWFQQADVTSPFSVLSGSTDPADVGQRAHLRHVVTAEQVVALDTAERLRVVAANADSRARAAVAEAEDATRRAADARAGADAELHRVRTAVDGHLRTLADLSAQRDRADAALRELEATDASLAMQRRRAEAFETDAEARSRAADDATRLAASARLASSQADSVGDPVAGGDPSGPDAEVRTVIDRALSTLGATYAWGGGDASGPTRGIRDGGVADAFGDFDKIGFDCSGLMIYAFAGVGRDLPHYSGYQAEAGPQVPLSQRRPGDLLFWADDDGVHHVALYLGNDRMIEAPQSGEVVRVTDVRFDDEIVPTVTRLL